jgi:hypothetical protein
MPCDVDLYMACIERLWTEFARPLSAWPTAERVHGVTVAYICPRSAGMDDSKHRPAKVLTDYSSCSCGWRERRAYERNPYPSDERVSSHLKSYRIGPCWWPVVFEDGSKKLHVCPYAKFADDPWHALSMMGDDGYRSCICGKDWHENFNEAKVMEAH